jgi:acylpyruvate hydrolase
MRLVTYSYHGSTRAGAVLNEWIVDLERAYADLLRSRGVPAAAERARALVPPGLRQLLEREEEGLMAAHEAFAYVADRLQAQGQRFQEEGIVVAMPAVRLRPPIPDPHKIICLGRNYREHAEEAGMPLPEAPELFAKYANTLIGHEDAIPLPRVSDRIDYEAELAVVIGRRGRYIGEADAYGYVAGYTIFHDVSARDFQMRTSQWVAGKTFDGFGPMGPWLVTRDEIPDPHRLRIMLQIGEEVLQDANTGMMVFGVPQLVAYISQILTLEPGDVIATGTPSGVGFTRKPPRFLRPGEVVRIFIEGIGTLQNPVVAEQG